MYHINKAAGIKSDKEMEQYYGQMKKAKKQMGELDFLTDIICRKLEIDK